MQLGQKAKDKITGFVGTITGMCEYISGCSQVLLVPTVDDKGSHREGHWFDEQRIEVLNVTPIVLNNEETPGFDL